VASLPDPQTVAGIIREVVEAEVLPRFRRLADAEIRHKEGGAVVSVADEAAERAMAPRLLDLLPGSAVVGEETADARPETLAVLDQPDTPTWIIDPVDGTQNFVDHRDTFACILALVRDGETLAGWIHDPVNDRTAIAAKGDGAWLGDERLQVAAPAPFAEMRGGFALGVFGQARREAIRAQRDRFARIDNLRCAGHDYLRLLRGEIHFRLFSRNLRPWDHAAGSMMHAEAGGVSAMLDGTPYRPVASAHSILMAPDPETLQALRRFFNDGA
jgi:fructose-1,6-bisphosphatase/inositol monophosphatase family enzyme